MKTTEELFSLIKQSDITLIGYSFKDERIKDEFISNFNYIEIEKFDSSFSFKSFLRNLKLNSVIEDKSIPDFILLDINNINFNTSDTINRPKQIGIALQKIRENMYSEHNSSFPSNPQFRLIITCPLNRSIIGDEKNFSGGNHQLYMSDVAMTIEGDIIKVIKNRLGKDGDSILYKFNYGKSLKVI